MLTPLYTTAFARDLRRAIRRGKDAGKIKAVVRLLCAGEALPASFRDHALKGEWAGFRDCHVEPDLVLVYRVVRDRLQLLCLRLGTHADLFGK